MKSAVRQVKDRIPQRNLLQDSGAIENAWIDQRGKRRAIHFENYKMCGEGGKELRTMSVEKVNSWIILDVMGEITETLSGKDSTLNLEISVPW